MLNNLNYKKIYHLDFKFLCILLTILLLSKPKNIYDKDSTDLCNTKTTFCRFKKRKTTFS